MVVSSLCSPFTLPPCRQEVMILVDCPSLVIPPMWDDGMRPAVGCDFLTKGLCETLVSG